MIRNLIAFGALILLAALFSCQSGQQQLKNEITALLDKQDGYFAVAFRDLNTGEEIFIHEHESFHAASTMKTPVLIDGRNMLDPAEMRAAGYRYEAVGRAAPGNGGDH